MRLKYCLAFPRAGAVAIPKTSGTATMAAQVAHWHPAQGHGEPESIQWDGHGSDAIQFVMQQESLTSKSSRTTSLHSSDRPSNTTTPPALPLSDGQVRLPHETWSPSYGIVFAAGYATLSQKIANAKAKLAVGSEPARQLNRTSPTSNSIKNPGPPTSSLPFHTKQKTAEKSGLAVKTNRTLPPTPPRQPTSGYLQNGRHVMPDKASVQDTSTNNELDGGFMAQSLGFLFGSPVPSIQTDSPPLSTPPKETKPSIYAQLQIRPKDQPTTRLNPVAPRSSTPVNMRQPTGASAPPQKKKDEAVDEIPVKIKPRKRKAGREDPETQKALQESLERRAAKLKRRQEARQNAKLLEEQKALEEVEGITKRMTVASLQELSPQEAEIKRQFQLERDVKEIYAASARAELRKSYILYRALWDDLKLMKHGTMRLLSSLAWYHIERHREVSKYFGQPLPAHLKPARFEDVEVSTLKFKEYHAEKRKFWLDMADKLRYQHDVLQGIGHTSRQCTAFLRYEADRYSPVRRHVVAVLLKLRIHQKNSWDGLGSICDDFRDLLALSGSDMTKFQYMRRWDWKQVALLGEKCPKKFKPIASRLEAILNSRAAFVAGFTDIERWLPLSLFLRSNCFAEIMGEKYMRPLKFYLHQRGKFQGIITSKKTEAYQDLLNRHDHYRHILQEVVKISDSKIATLISDFEEMLCAREKDPDERKKAEANAPMLRRWALSTLRKYRRQYRLERRDEVLAKWEESKVSSAKAAVRRIAIQATRKANKRGKKELVQMKCQSCGKVGHKGADCPNATCLCCQKRGHTVKNRPKLRRRASAGLYCGVCKIHGHSTGDLQCASKPLEAFQPLQASPDWSSVTPKSSDFLQHDTVLSSQTSRPDSSAEWNTLATQQEMEVERVGQVKAEDALKEEQERKAAKKRARRVRRKQMLTSQVMQSPTLASSPTLPLARSEPLVRNITSGDESRRDREHREKLDRRNREQQRLEKEKQSTEERELREELDRRNREKQQMEREIKQLKERLALEEKIEQTKQEHELLRKEHKELTTALSRRRKLSSEISSTTTTNATFNGGPEDKNSSTSPSLQNEKQSWSKIFRVRFFPSGNEENGPSETGETNSPSQDGVAPLRLPPITLRNTSRGYRESQLRRQNSSSNRSGSRSYHAWTAMNVGNLKSNGIGFSSTHSMKAPHPRPDFEPTPSEHEQESVNSAVEEDKPDIPPISSSSLGQEIPGSQSSWGSIKRDDLKNPETSSIGSIGQFLTNSPMFRGMNCQDNPGNFQKQDMPSESTIQATVSYPTRWGTMNQEKSDSPVQWGSVNQNHHGSEESPSLGSRENDAQNNQDAASSSAQDRDSDSDLGEVNQGQEDNSDADHSGAPSSVTGSDDEGSTSGNEIPGDDEGSSEESGSESSSEEGEQHTPLAYQIPREKLRQAMEKNSTNPLRGCWSFEKYRGPNGEDDKVQLHYCTNMKVAEKVAQYFVDEKVLGFDIEWKPNASATSGIKGNASLLQLASEDRIALFHISLFKGTTVEELLPPTIKQILENPDILKTGVAVKSDFTRLRKFLGVEARGVFELSHLYKLVKFSVDEPKKVNRSLVSLANQVLEHLQLPLAKGEVRESDWSRPLIYDQMSYAASDAYAGFRLYDVLESKRKKLKPTPPRPHPAELGLPIALAPGVEDPRIKLRKPALSKEVPVESSDEYESALEEQEVIDESDEDASSFDLSADDELSDDEFAAPPTKRVGRVRLDGLGRAVPVVPTPQEPQPEEEEPIEPASEPPDSDTEAITTNIGRVRPSPDTADASPTDPSASPPSKSSELELAEFWVDAWRSSLPPTHKVTATPRHLHAYALWHEQGLELDDIAAQMRTPPLALSTIANYVLNAVALEDLPFKEERILVLLKLLPGHLITWRFKRILKRVEG